MKEDSATAQCRKILKKHNINYDDLDPDNLDCDACPGFDECVIAFTGRS